MAPKKDATPDEEAPLLPEKKDPKKEEPEMCLEEIGLKKGWSGHYNPNSLASVQVFTMIAGTVLVDRRIWAVCGTLALLAFTIAGLIYFFFPGAHKLDLEEVGYLVKSLKVFLAFLLGMFMNNSIARWWTTVNALTDYFNNVEKLIYCANAFGLPADKREQVVRYCVVSCYCLSTEVTSTWIKDEVELDRSWRRAFDRLAFEGFLKADEAVELCKIRPADRAGCALSFVAAVLCEMFERSKSIGPQAMNRMVLQCQVAVDMVAQLKVQICVQMPFMYVHMLAVLVHLNNLMVAVTCGLGLGGALSAIMHSAGNADTSGVVGSSQNLAMTLVTLFVEPMLYQAFLQIGTNFCYPFGKEKHHVPVQWMIVDLVHNLQQMNFIADSRATGITKLAARKRFTGFWHTIRAGDDAHSEASFVSGVSSKT